VPFPFEDREAERSTSSITVVETVRLEDTMVGRCEEEVHAMMRTRRLASIDGNSDRRQS
jgi:hypothetical protein